MDRRLGPHGHAPTGPRDTLGQIGPAREALRGPSPQTLSKLNSHEVPCQANVHVVNTQDESARRRGILNNSGFLHVLYVERSRRDRHPSVTQQQRVVVVRRRDRRRALEATRWTAPRGFSRDLAPAQDLHRCSHSEQACEARDKQTDATDTPWGYAQPVRLPVRLSRQVGWPAGTRVAWGARGKRRQTVVTHRSVACVLQYYSAVRMP